MKLVVEEVESAALAEFVKGAPVRVSSVVALVEVARAARRTGGDAALKVATEVLEGIDLVDLDATVIAVARTLDPVELRTLDAIHLASALSLGDDLGAFVTYGQRLDTAARAAGVAVIAPA